MLNSDVANRLWHHLAGRFAEFQFVLVEDGLAVAAGNAVPIRWNRSLQDLPSGWDEALRRGVREYEQNAVPNTLCALAMSVATTHRGQRLSSVGLRAMREFAERKGFHSLIAPVRPTLKSRYPLTSMTSYATWMQADGAPFDPWVRTHWRLGAKTLRVAPCSMVIRGGVSEWETWTQMRFPESGKYVVPGALQPIDINLEHNIGHYEDPNIWMRHAFTK